MKPVFQTKLTKEEGGNCFAACIASIFEITLEDLPQPTPIEVDSEEGWKLYASSLVQYLALNHGYFHFMFDWKEFERTTKKELDRLNLPYIGILSGKSPRGEHLHSVVYQNGKIVHDPNPLAEILEEKLETFEDILFFVPCDPARK